MFKFVSFIVTVAVVAALPTKEVVDPRIDLNGSWRVVGGSDAANGAYPFIVTLRSLANNHFCGGSILNDRFILTASHCVIGRATLNTFTVVGTNTLNSGGSRYGTNRLTVHADYNSATTQNDIAVIQLSSAITYSNLVAPTLLNTADTGAVASILIGWGRTSTGGAIPNNLQELATNTISHADCESVWAEFVTPNQICAFTRAGEGACNGDSGGPLIEASNGAQLGVVSFGIACAQGFPDVYARVSSYVSWINGATAN